MRCWAFVKNYEFKFFWIQFQFVLHHPCLIFLHALANDVTNGCPVIVSLKHCVCLRVVGITMIIKAMAFQNSSYWFCIQAVEHRSENGALYVALHREGRIHRTSHPQLWHSVCVHRDNSWTRWGPFLVLQSCNPVFSLARCGLCMVSKAAERSVITSTVIFPWSRAFSSPTSMTDYGGLGLLECRSVFSAKPSPWSDSSCRQTDKHHSSRSMSDGHWFVEIQLSRLSWLVEEYLRLDGSFPFGCDEKVNRVSIDILQLAADKPRM